ncbi:VWA domain-containing protein [bacterium]|nr:VWA domain-containing protein [bacterium]
MRYTRDLFISFFLSVLIHVLLGFYLDRTPWSHGELDPFQPAGKFMEVQMVPDSSAYRDDTGLGGDPLVREQELRRTLEQEADRAPSLPEITQQEWFSPESVAIEAPQEDLVARADAELSNLPGNPQSESIRSEIIRVPEPRVEAPNPDSRVWAPELSDSPPPQINLDAPLLPPPVQEEPSLLPSFESVAVAPPPVVIPEEILPPPPPSPVELPQELLTVETPEKETAPASLPEDRAEFKAWDDLLDVEIITYRPEKGAGFFRVSVKPNEETGKLKPMNKDVLLAIDASGSMEGEVFEGIRKGMLGILKDLKPGDRFNILAFRADVVALNPGLWPVAEKNIAEGVDFINGLEPGGKTDIYRSLATVVRSLPPGDRPFLIILCTDGRSTVGLQDTREIINALSIENRLRAAIHVFGAGEYVNRHLLGLLAYRNKGIARFAGDPGKVSDDILKLSREVAEPILVDLKVDLSGMTEDEAYPLVLPDLYRGGRVQFYGRYNTEKEISLRLTGNVRGNPKEFVYRGKLPGPEPKNVGIAEAWASAKAFNLLSQNLELGETEERIQAIRELSRLYRLEIPSR